MSQLLTDEIGQAFQISIDDNTRIKGNECILNNIAVVKKITDFLSTSFGPTGMDKILQSKDDDIIVTNDGATILKEMGMSDNPISKLIIQLSESQYQEFGDGTTGVVILASALLKEAEKLLSQGVHPIKISEGFDFALSLAVEHMEKISENVDDVKKSMINAAKTCLSSKIVSKSLDKFAGICADAVLNVADMKRKDVSFDLINIKTEIGKDVSESELVSGIVIKKEFSHNQMKKSLNNAKIALLACPFEPPKLKNKHTLLINNSEEYKKLQAYEKLKFNEMIDSLKKAKVDLVMCQWGFDDEANSLLLENDIPAIRWVGGNDLDLISLHIGANIISRFEDLTEQDLGVANVEERIVGTENQKVIVIENKKGKKAATILIKGANDMVTDEAKRCVEDGISVCRNVLKSDKIVYGGGSSEISCSLFLEKSASNHDGELQCCILSYSRSLEEIPMMLAMNSGFDPYKYLSDLRKKQIETKNSFLGVDCLEQNQNNMKKLNVFDTLKSKVGQLQMATQLANMILKIDDMIVTGSE